MNLIALLQPLEKFIADATAADCPELMGSLERLKAMALLKMTTPSNSGAVAGPEMYTIKEVAKILKLSEDRIYELARQNKLPHCKIGKKSVRVSAAQLAAFQRSQEI